MDPHLWVGRRGGAQPCTTQQIVSRRIGGGQRGPLAQARGGDSDACGGGRGSGRERVGVHVQVPRSCPNLSSTSAPPLSLFLSLYNASSTLAARALTSGTSAGADWADWRVRESGSAVLLFSYSGNRVSNPGRGGGGVGMRGEGSFPPT